MRRAVVSLLVVVAVAAGCGGSSKKTAATATSTTVSTVPGVTTTVDAKFTGKGSKAFCALAARIQKQLDRRDLTNPTPSSLRQSFHDTVDALNQMAAAAPAEIKADVQLMQRVFADLTRVLDSVNYDPSKIKPQDRAKYDALESPDVEKALSRFDQYGAKVCHIGDTTVTSR